MTKKELAEIIESDQGTDHDRIRINARGEVSGHEIGTPDRYDSNTNTGGRKLIAMDTEILVSLVEYGVVTQEQCDKYCAKFA